MSFIEQVPLTNEDIKSLKKLAKKDGNYRLRATVKTTDDKQTTFLTFVKAVSDWFFFLQLFSFLISVFIF